SRFYRTDFTSTSLHHPPFFFTHPPPTPIYTLSLHDALPISLSTFYQDSLDPFDPAQVEISTTRLLAKAPTIASYAYKKSIGHPRSEEHTSELQSRGHLVCRLLLEKKKK